MRRLPERSSREGRGNETPHSIHRRNGFGRDGVGAGNQYSDKHAEQDPNADAYGYGDAYEHCSEGHPDPDADEDADEHSDSADDYAADANVHGGHKLYGDSDAAADSNEHSDSDKDSDASATHGDEDAAEYQDPDADCSDQSDSDIDADAITNADKNAHLDRRERCPR